MTNLFFADGLILMAKADTKCSATINRVVQDFCSKSGQNINYSKSKIFFSNNCDIDQKNNVSSIIKIKSGVTIGKYLVFPIFHKKPTLKDFQFIIDNIRNKLGSWKTKFLNITGRATLNNISTHLMQYIKLPSQISKKIDQAQRNFI